MQKRLIPFLWLCAAFLPLSAGTKALNFENPGNRRLLKTEAGNYYYYRSLPEKSMTLNVDGISAIELRSFAIENLRKPSFIAVIGKTRTAYDLTLKERLDGYYLYNPVSVPVPKGTKSLEILCYERSIYFRPFHTVTPAPKPKTVKIPNLSVRAHGGVISVTHNGSDSPYYVFNPSQSVKFTLNNKRDAVVYVRARLLDRSLPVFELYRNGKLLQTYEFSLKRTTKYKATGIEYLSVGLKLALPPNTGTAEYELRAKSDHLFMARPVLLKAK
ncbi:MAG TPA: hypothetical protein PLG20_05385 [Candidatus Syntrophosphaera sp.]|jgi:hypothetical protein|nr:hypothetical protein [Candidatus Syntrophosphaera sp.]